MHPRARPHTYFRWFARPRPSVKTQPPIHALHCNIHTFVSRFLTPPLSRPALSDTHRMERWKMFAKMLHHGEIATAFDLLRPPPSLSFVLTRISFPAPCVFLACKPSSNGHSVSSWCLTHLARGLGGGGCSFLTWVNFSFFWTGVLLFFVS